MSNYRRYQPYRKHYQPSRGRWSIVGWIVVGIVLLILIRNGIGGSKQAGDGDAAKKDEISLVNGNANTNAVAPLIAGKEITTKDCTKAISQASTTKSFVALTLDGGGSIIGDAVKVLDVLKEKNAAATLFVTGKWAEDNVDVVKAYSDANIDVFNHSYAHDSYNGLTGEKIVADLEKAEAAIQDVTLKSTKPYFRPPFGDINDTAITEIRRQGYCAILWTVDAADWKDGATVDGSKEIVLKRLKNGAIVMLQANSDIAKDLVGPLVDEIRGQGYTLVPLRDLLRKPESSANANSS